MVSLLGTLCVLLCIAVLILTIRIISLRHAADELRREFAVKLQEDTNVGIDISTSDSKMKQLAADMDWQLKLLRKEHLRYVQGDRELKDAVTNISHDLRTPLTAICGYMELLSEEEISETVRNYLSVIENRIQALKELTEELFRYSVIMSVDFAGEKEEVSLNSAIEECVAGFYGAFKDAGIEPEIVMPEKEVKRELNRQALSRILSNIASNAIKYSDGDFLVTLEENGTSHFSNHAEGLDTVQVAHLFDRFYTVENGKNSTGLGLSIARTLVEEIGGHFGAEYREGMLHMWLKF